MLNSLIDRYCKLISVLVALCLLVMVVMVFGNVVLRYGFNSGLAVSEELSRWLFVWMTFLGAVIALRDNAHLGTDMLVSRLGPLGKRICMGLSLLLMLYSLWLLCRGSYEQLMLNIDSESPVMQVSMGWFHASGLVFGVLGAPILVLDLHRLLTGQIDNDHLMLIQESEEAPHGDDHTAPTR